MRPSSLFDVAGFFPVDPRIVGFGLIRGNEIRAGAVPAQRYRGMRQRHQLPPAATPSEILVSTTRTGVGSSRQDEEKRRVLPR